MKRAYLFLLILVACSVSVFSQNKNNPVITVLDFETNEVSRAEMRTIISLLSAALFKIDCFTVIDVSQRDTVLKELKFSMSGCSDESCMLEIGKMLSAEAIIMGSIGRVGTKYVLSAKILETETAKTLNTAVGIYKDLDELLDNIFDIALEIAVPYASTHDVAAEPEPKKPVKLNIPAFASFASAGVGLGFLAVSIPLLIEYWDAQTAYEEASDPSEITALYDTYEEARQAAKDGYANINFIIGTSLTVGGIALGILFSRTPKEDSPEVDVAFLLGPAVSTLAFSVRY